MAFPPLDIEAIVREVLRRLEHELTAAAAPTQPAASPAPAATAAPAATVAKPPVNGHRQRAAEPGSLTISDRVVTLASVKERLGGVKHLLVPAGAVLTPSVRDELRKRKIQLQFVRPTAASSATTDGSGLLVASHSGGYDADAVLATIRGEAGSIQPLASSDLAGLVQQLSSAVGAQRLPAILLTADPAAAVCLANRQPGLRAAWGINASAVERACRSIGANVLVIDPAAESSHEVKNTIRRFLQGSHECPQQWRQALG